MRSSAPYGTPSSRHATLFYRLGAGKWKLEVVDKPE